MAGIADMATIDVVAQSASGDVLVVMVETRSWGTDHRQPSQLREKINAYAGFVLDGSLLRRYPEAAGRPVFIQLDCPEAPAGEFAAIIEHATVKLSQRGIGVRVNVRS